MTFEVESGDRMEFNVTGNEYVRPVINLKADTEIKGLGSSLSPYKVQ